jgi:DNA-directed RNA polymerase specialized sigma24 family protein
VEEIIDDFRRLITRPNKYIRRYLGRILDSPEWSKDDLVNELVVRLLECPDAIIYKQEYNVYRFVYNICRNISRKLLARPEKSFDYKDIENYYCENNECSLSDSNKILYSNVEQTEILEEIDRQVLEGYITRRDAAEMLGVSGNTYQKKLYRKNKRLRKALDN